MTGVDNMKRGDLVLFGGWYLADVYEELAISLGWRVLGKVDPQPRDNASRLQHVPSAAYCFVAIGDNSLREFVSQELQRHGRKLATLIHPSAVVSSSATIGAGSYIGESAVLRTQSLVGEGVIVNAGAVVSHHTAIESFVSVGPNVALASQTSIGRRTMVGVGACIRPQVKVGTAAMIGAGSVVIHPVPDNATVVGNPAREIRPSGTSPTPQSDWKSNRVW